jgi:hypothetical protein
LDKKIKEAANLQRSVTHLEIQIETLQNTANKAGNERDKLAADKKVGKELMFQPPCLRANISVSVS